MKRRKREKEGGREGEVGVMVAAAKAAVILVDAGCCVATMVVIAKWQLWWLWPSSSLLG